MRFKNCLLFTVVALAAAAAIAPSSSVAQDPQAANSEGDIGAEVRELNEVLKARLYARRDEEIAYIDAVTKMVDEGKLPRSLVQSTYLWARYKKPRPFIYFQRALQLRAEKMDLKTPPFKITTAGFVPQLR
ncbi:MAG: hypothetical protein NXI22_08665 [bacterium]|nr:hypothetical protein [bacterium]